MAHPTPASGRVVVTGLGAITPLGTGTEITWEGLLAGRNGVRRISLMDATGYTTQIAGEVPDFNPEDFLDKKDARRVDRFLAFAAAGAKLALADAAFPEDPEIKENTGVLIGSGIGGLTFLAEQHRKQIASGPDRVSPFLVPYMIPDMASGYTSIVTGLKGPNLCVVTACATGANSIGEAYHIIKRGDAVAMVAGGCEAPINEIGLVGFCSARAMTSSNNDTPERASRPFDKERDGFVMAEGVGAVVLEDYAFAKARGARIYGEIIGYGLSGDAYHMTAPDPDGAGAIRSMTMAMQRAGLQPEQIGYINAHGTSTPYNDRQETAAIKAVLGEHAHHVPISSTKSMIGHTLGAAGAIEFIVCMLTLRDQKIHPTMNYEFPDPECDLDYVPNEARAAKVDYTLSNSFGFGGHNATLIAGHVQD